MSGTDGQALTASWAGSGQTDASGNVTFNLPAGRFDVAPVVVAAVQANSSGLYFVRVVSVTNTQIVVNIMQTVAVTVATISVLASATPANFTTVGVIARKAG